MDRLTEGLTENHDFVGGSVGQECNLSFPEFKNQFIPLISLCGTASFRYLQPDWAPPLMSMPIPIFFNQLLISMNLYQHART